MEGILAVNAYLKGEKFNILHNHIVVISILTTDIRIFCA